MKVFFTCSYTGRKKYLKDFLKTLEIISSYKDVEVFTPEGGDDNSYRLTDGKSYLDVLNLRRKVKFNSISDAPFETKEHKFIHHEAIRMCIKMSDAVIIDGTYPSFRLGNEATISVQQKKPTLVLSQFKDYSDFINSPYLHGAKYNKYNIREIVTNFLDKAQKQILKNRFNMMISDGHKEKLELVASSKGISQAEVLRELLENV